MQKIPNRLSGRDKYFRLGKTGNAGILPAKRLQKRSKASLPFNFTGSESL
jgi:hypothetical protein